MSWNSFSELFENSIPSCFLFVISCLSYIVSPHRLGLNLQFFTCSNEPITVLHFQVSQIGNKLGDKRSGFWSSHKYILHVCIIFAFCSFYFVLWCGLSFAPSYKFRSADWNTSLFVLPPPPTPLSLSSFMHVAACICICRCYSLLGSWCPYMSKLGFFFFAKNLHAYLAEDVRSLGFLFKDRNYDFES